MSNNLEKAILEYFENQANTEGNYPKEDTANIMNIIEAHPEIFNKFIKGCDDEK